MQDQYMMRSLNPKFCAIENPHTIEDLAEALETMQEDGIISFINNLNLYFVNVTIRSYDDFDCILKKIPEGVRMEFIKKLGIEFVKSHINGNHYEIWGDTLRLLCSIPTNVRLEFINILGIDWLDSRIRNCVLQFISLLEEIPESTRIDFIDDHWGMDHDLVDLRVLWLLTNSNLSLTNLLKISKSRLLDVPTTAEEVKLKKHIEELIKEKKLLQRTSVLTLSHFFRRQLKEEEPGFLLKIMDYTKFGPFPAEVDRPNVKKQRFNY